MPSNIARESWLMKDKKRIRRKDLFSFLKYRNTDSFSVGCGLLISGVLLLCDSDIPKNKKQNTSNTKTEEIEKGKEN